MDQRVLRFGPFEVRPAERLLLEDGAAVPLGSRALDLLVALAERAGQVVGKDELLRRVWPAAVVEEATLRVHIAALRRVLHEGRDGQRYIVNVSGRGYTFVAPIDRPQVAAPAPTPVAGLRWPGGRLVGRDATVAALAAKVALRRFVTVAGPGGVGKTAVAQHAAAAMAKDYEAVLFIDLAAVRQPGLVPSALASAVGLPARQDDPTDELVAALAGRRLLMLLDSCEHLVDAVARLVERIFAETPQVHLLATSREPLRARGEWVTRLGPLDTPPPTAPRSVEAALAWPAVQLFVECAAAAHEPFALTPSNAELVAGICRRLDGMPLAIELAAARVDTLGVHGLHHMLDDHLALLHVPGRRSAQDRHRTLQATLDWSYGLLTADEQALLRRLGVFAGHFGPEAALVVAGVLASAGFGDHIASLVAKSLVVADLEGVDIRYRLLDTTRAYAREKLAEAGEAERVAQSHARHCLERFRGAQRDTEQLAPADWQIRYAPLLDDLRAALDWAFSAGGDARVAVELVIAGVPLWNRLLLMRECQANIERALATPRSARNATLDMALFSALGATVSHANLSSPHMSAAWARALELARRTGDRAHELQSLWGLWVTELNKAHFRAALGLAQDFCAVAAGSSDPNDAFVGDRLVAYTLHFLGDQAGARLHIERMLDGYRPTERETHRFRFQFDQRVIGRMTLGLVAWLQGDAEEAMRSVEENVRDGEAIGHPLSLCNALIKSALPVALLSGRVDVATRYLGLLLERIRPHSLFMWHPVGRCYEGLLQIAEGQLEPGRQAVRAALEELPNARFAFPQSWVMSVLASADLQCGATDLARATIDAAVTQARADEERWCLPELLRVQALVLQQQGSQTAREAAQAVRQEALEMARADAVPGWARRIEADLR